MVMFGLWAGFKGSSGILSLTPPSTYTKAYYVDIEHLVFFLSIDEDRMFLSHLVERNRLMKSYTWLVLFASLEERLLSNKII